MILIPLLVLILVMINVACAPRPDSLDAADTYAAETLRIIVPFSAGGTHDLHARIMARYLGEHIPGNPMVVVENMTGAGGMVAAQDRAYGRARTDERLACSAQASRSLLSSGGQHELRCASIPHHRLTGRRHSDLHFLARDALTASKPGWRPRRRVAQNRHDRPRRSHAFSMIVTWALDLPIRPVVGYGGCPTSDALSTETRRTAHVSGWRRPQPEITRNMRRLLAIPHDLRNLMTAALSPTQQFAR